MFRSMNLIKTKNNYNFINKNWIIYFLNKFINVCLKLKKSLIIYCIYNIKYSKEISFTFPIKKILYLNKIYIRSNLFIYTRILKNILLIILKLNQYLFEVLTKTEYSRKFNYHYFKK